MTPMTLPPGAVTCLDGVLTGAECRDVLDELEHAWWWDSPLVHRGPNGALVSRPSYRRTSTTTSEAWMGETTIRLLRRVERRLHRRFAVRPDHLEQWQAVYVPARTPTSRVQRLNAEINKAIADPAIVELADKLGVTLVGGTPQHLAKVQEADSVTWAKVIRDGRIKAD